VAKLNVRGWAKGVAQDIEGNDGAVNDGGELAAQEDAGGAEMVGDRGHPGFEEVEAGVVGVAKKGEIPLQAGIGGVEGRIGDDDVLGGGGNRVVVVTVGHEVKVGVVWVAVVSLTVALGLGDRAGGAIHSLNGGVGGSLVEDSFGINGQYAGTCADV